MEQKLFLLKHLELGECTFMSNLIAASAACDSRDLIILLAKGLT